jgi:hypothetical protein
MVSIGRWLVLTQYRTIKDAMKRSQLRTGLLTSYGQFLTGVGRRIKDFMLNEQPDETWVNFALAEAMEELCGAEYRKYIGCDQERIQRGAATVSKKKEKKSIISEVLESDQSDS